VSRVDLRPVVRADGPALVRMNRDSRDHHRPWAEPFTDMVGFEAWLASLGESAVGLVGREASTGEVVGVANLSQIFRKGFQNAYLGFYGSAALAGRGLMTETVRLAAAYAFGELGLHRLEANVQPDNARSLALIRRAGFRKEGFSPRYLKIAGAWRDHERWAILADD
jgi:ribosomal-protein-alanine N-acetyltransferase